MKWQEDSNFEEEGQGKTPRRRLKDAQRAREKKKKRLRKQQQQRYRQRARRLIRSCPAEVARGKAALQAQRAVEGDLA